jgi:hypothetical protein
VRWKRWVSWKQITLACLVSLLRPACGSNS